MAITPIRKPWCSTMSGRERFNNQMHYKPVDRSFNMEFGYWEENYKQWPIFVDNGITTEDEADELFAFDYGFGAGINAWFSHPMPQTILEETESHIIRVNGIGVVEKVPRDGHSSIPHYMRSSIETPEDWKRVKEEYFSRTHPNRERDFAKLDIKCAKDRDWPAGVNVGSMIGLIRDMLTVEGLAYAMYDYPEMVEDMVETCCVLVEDALDKLLPRYEFDYAYGWEDICFKNGPLVSVDFFRNVIAPRYKRINNKLKKAGIDLWYMDCDGDVRPILRDFLDNGVNCLFPFEVNCCCHPGELLNEYGGELRIMGGFDKIQMIKGKDTIKAYMKTLEPLVAKGGFIPFCDHRCPPDVTQENYFYYLDLKEATFG